VSIEGVTAFMAEHVIKQADANHAARMFLNAMFCSNILPFNIEIASCFALAKYLPAQFLDFVPQQSTSLVPYLTSHISGKCY
jgi:hypothetical protein